MIKKTDKGTIQIDVSRMGKWCKTKASDFITNFREYRKKKREAKSQRILDRLLGTSSSKFTRKYNDKIIEKFVKWKCSPIPTDEFDPSLDLNMEFRSHPTIGRDYERELIRKRQLAHDNDMNDFMSSIKSIKPPPPPSPPPKGAPDLATIIDRHIKKSKKSYANKSAEVLFPGLRENKIRKRNESISDMIKRHKKSGWRRWDVI